jgi:hypothetical protein
VNLQVTDTHPETIELRALVSARNAPQSWDLRCEIREKLVAFIREKMPEAFPHGRNLISPSGRDLDGMFGRSRLASQDLAKSSGASANH